MEGLPAGYGRRDRAGRDRLHQPCFGLRPRYRETPLAGRGGRTSASGGPALSASGDVLFAGAASRGWRARHPWPPTTHRSGEEIWRSELDDEVSNPADRLWVSGDVVIAPLLSGDIVALDAGTGEELWRYTPPAPRLGNVTVEGGDVWFALQNGEVLALDAESGEIVARSNDYSLNLNSTSLAQRPAVRRRHAGAGGRHLRARFRSARGAGGP